MSSTNQIEPLYVLDTHALFWYLTGDVRLSPRVKLLFEAAERGETRMVVSAISIAELYYAHQKRKMATDFAKIYTDLELKPYLRIVPFNAEDVLDFKHDSAVPEMHDRIIVGLTRRLGAPLITLDPQIVAANLVKIVW
jgi:PIN domain nuclease of toxin-antitoxin system